MLEIGFFCLGTLYGTRVYIPDENKGGLITSASRLLGGGSSVNYDESYSAITKKKYYGIRQSILESPLADLLEVFYGTNPIGPVNTQLLHDAFVNRSHGGLDDLLWIRENEQGIYHFMNRDFDSAVSMFSKINSQVSDNIINMYRLGVSLEAKASVTGFKKNNPSEWTSTMNSAINQYVNALQLIQKRRYSWIGPAGQERPSKFEPKSQLTVLMQLADAYNCVGEYDLARKLWQKAKDINPGCYEAQIKASMLAIKLPSFKRFFGLLSSKNTD